MNLWCRNCSGEGRIFKSRYGGNDPDVWDGGQCEQCEGTGAQKCEARGCTEPAIGCDEDGEALCVDCLAEWAANYGAED